MVVDGYCVEVADGHGKGSHDPAQQSPMRVQRRDNWAAVIAFGQAVIRDSLMNSRKQGSNLSTLLHCPTRHGDVVFQVVSSFVAQSVDLSVWQEVQGLGILYLSVIAGELNLKVCERTNVPGTP